MGDIRTMTKKGWLGPYALAARHADDVTLADLVDLRKRLAEAERQRDNALDAVVKLQREKSRLEDWFNHVVRTSNTVLKYKL